MRNSGLGLLLGVRCGSKEFDRGIGALDMASSQYEAMPQRNEYRNLWHTDLLSTIQVDCPCMELHSLCIFSFFFFFFNVFCVCQCVCVCFAYLILTASKISCRLLPRVFVVSVLNIFVPITLIAWWIFNTFRSKTYIVM